MEAEGKQSEGVWGGVEIPLPVAEADGTEHKVLGK